MDVTSRILVSKSTLWMRAVSDSLATPASWPESLRSLPRPAANW